MLNFKEFQAKARELFGKLNCDPAGDDPITFLHSLPWEIPNGPAFSEEEVARMNIDFDVRGCFGRALKAAVLVEKYFPNETFYNGEVLEDLLRSMLMKKVTPEKWHDDTYVAEILQYENPHVAIVWNDSQFDPIFSLLTDRPETLKHPSILKHSQWEGLYCYYLVSSGMLLFRQKQNPNLYLQALKQAEAICPHMLLVKENLVSALCALNRFDESVAIAKSLVGKRKDAKMLWFLLQMTGDPAYKDRLVREYDIQMLHFLNKAFIP
ncbi:MAG: hypothetical protein WCO65_00870 [bacterium]